MGFGLHPVYLGSCCSLLHRMARKGERRCQRRGGNVWCAPVFGMRVRQKLGTGASTGDDGDGVT